MALNKQWIHILKKYNILSEISTNGFYELTADKIKAQFEPRLLCYQTSEKERPCILIDNNIFVLPIKNGHYLLSKINLYQSLKYGTDTPIQINGDNESILNKIGSNQ
jgi:hypothetical protein